MNRRTHQVRSPKEDVVMMLGTQSGERSDAWGLNQNPGSGSSPLHSNMYCYLGEII